MTKFTIESHEISTSTYATMEKHHTNALASPPDTTSPPGIITGKRAQANGAALGGREREGSEAVDPGALSKALREFEEAGRVRERTPGGSPSRKRQRVYGDRLVMRSRAKEIERGHQGQDNTGRYCCCRPVPWRELITQQKIMEILMLTTRCTIGSFQIARDRIYKPASVSYMTTHLLPLHPEPDEDLQMENFIFKKVCLDSLTQRCSC